MLTPQPALGTLLAPHASPVSDPACLGLQNIAPDLKWASHTELGDGKPQTTPSPAAPVLTAVLVPMTALLLAWAAWVIMALMLAKGSGLGLAAAAKQGSTDAHQS